MEANTVLKNHASLDYHDTVTLDYDQRCKRRCLFTTDNNLSFLLNLNQATTLAQGDILKLSNGTHVLVHEAEEDVLDINTEEERLLRFLIWSLGNRHLPVEIREQGVRLRYDALLEKEYSLLPIKVLRHKAPFSPKNITEQFIK